MSKSWITAVIATAIVGSGIGYALSERAQPSTDNALQPTPASPQATLPPSPTVAAAGVAADSEQVPVQAKPAKAPAGTAQVLLWEADSLQEEETDGIVRHHTRLDPQQIETLHTGQIVALAVPGREQPLRASLSETRNTAGAAVWHGALIDGDEAESMTVVRGALETHISLATLDGSLSIIVDNATGKTVITDENQLVLRADPNDHLHYDHKELPPMPPPTQG